MVTHPLQLHSNPKKIKANYISRNIMTENLRIFNIFLKYVSVSAIICFKENTNAHLSPLFISKNEVYPMVQIF